MTVAVADGHSLALVIEPMIVVFAKLDGVCEPARGLSVRLRVQVPFEVGVGQPVVPTSSSVGDELG